MVRQGQAAGELTVSSNSRGVGAGVAVALGGGLLMIIGALMMAGRPRRTVVVDRSGTRAAGAPAPAARAPESNAIPTNPPTPSAPARPVRPAGNGSTAASDTSQAAPSERTGTERLSKEEREMLGLDEDTRSRGKQEP
jgi:hypothetical protein